MIADPRRIPRRRGRKVDSLFSQVVAFVREHEGSGGEVTNAMLVERFPRDSPATLRSYRHAARKGAGTGSGKGLPCATDPQKRRIQGRIRAMREIKIRRGERPDPVIVPLVRLRFGFERLAEG